MGVKFGTDEGTFGPLLRAKFHPHRCKGSPLRGEKPQNRPLSKLNTGRFALRAMLPVTRKKKMSALLVCWVYSSHVTVIRWGHRQSQQYELRTWDSTVSPQGSLLQYVLVTMLHGVLLARALKLRRVKRKYEEKQLKCNAKDKRIDDTTKTDRLWFCRAKYEFYVGEFLFTFH